MNFTKSATEYTLDDVATLIFHEERPGILSIDHILVQPDFQGRGLGGKILDEFVNDARANGSQLIPRCSFAKAAFLKRPTYKELQADV